MEVLFWLLILVYVLAPIPLLILFIVSRVQIRHLRRDKAEDAEMHHQEINRHLQVEENYRRYVNQLQRKVKELDPDAKIGSIDPQPHSPVPQSTVLTPPASSSLPAAAPAPAYTQPVSQLTKAPLPQPAASVPASRPLPAPSAPQMGSSPAPQKVPAAPADAPSSSDNAHTPVILTVGVILLLLASIGFISATWSILGSGVRAIALLSFSAIFLGAGILAKTKLKLSNTSIAFYSIGSVTLPITIFGASAFALLGGSFGLQVPALYNTLLLCFICLFVLLLFGAVFFRSRVFAAGSLISLSLSVFTLAVMFDYPYSLDLLLVTVFSSAVIFLSPYIGKIPESSRFFPYSRIFTIYAILNLYDMTVMAIFLSRNSVWSGIFLLVLAAAFFLSSVLKRETGLLSLPSIVLLLIGTAQIVGLHGILSFTIWILVVGLSLVALSLVPSTRKIFSRVLLYCGIVFLFASCIPICIYSLTIDSWGYIALAIVPCLALTYLSIREKKPLFFVGVIPPCFTLLWITAVRLMSLTTPYTGNVLNEYMRIGKSAYMLSETTVALLGLIVSGAMYAAFSFIPHHRFYTGTGNILLFGYLVYFLEFFALSIDDPYSMWFFGLTLLICAGSVVMACRTDTLNYRDPSLTEEPRSIRLNRCFYACIWPLFIFLFFSLKIGNAEDDSRVSLLALLLLALFTFLYTAFRIFRTGSGKEAFSGDSSSTATRICTWTSSLTMGVLLFFLMVIRFVSPSSDPFLYVMQHLAPILIPLLFVILLLREKHTDSSLMPFFYTLFGLLSLIAVVPFALQIPEAFGVSSSFLKPTFVFAVLSLVPLAAFAVSSLLPGGKKDQLPKAFISPRNQALFLWAGGIGIVLLFEFISGLLRNAYPVYPILLALMLISSMILFTGYIPSISSVSAALLTIVFIKTVHYYADDGYLAIPVWTEVLLFLLPVLVYSSISYLRKTDKLRRDPFFMGALFSQFLLFMIVPFLTIASSRALKEASVSIAGISHTSHILDHLFKGLFSLFYTCRYLFLLLPGFIVLEVLLLLKSQEKDKRRRAVALIILTMSTIVWMPILTLPSLSNLVEACYLLPTTILIFLLPWLFPGTKEKSDIASMRLIFSSIEMGILAVLTLATPKDTFCLILFGVISFLILLGGYFRRNKGFLILGTVCVLGMAVYIINRVWGDMSWWIYLFVTGTILITIAVRNEIKKRK